MLTHLYYAHMLKKLAIKIVLTFGFAVINILFIWSLDELLISLL